MNRSAQFHTRRDFLAKVGQGVLVASVGSSLALDLGLTAKAHADAAAGGGAGDTLSFGALDPLVALMQETPATQLLPKLVEKLSAGAELRQLVAAAALANARTFGGEDYVGFHTVMAMSPAWHMSQELSGPAAALPVFKVLYRNTNRIQETGGRKSEVLHPVSADVIPTDRPGGEVLRDAVRSKDMARAEHTFAGIVQSQQQIDAMLEQLLYAVHDNTEVHRIVLPYRAWDLLDVVGKEHAHTMLRQSVHYCVKAEAWNRGAEWDTPRKLLPAMLDEHHLPGKAVGDKTAEDKFVEELSRTIFSSTPQQAAAAAASALAEGFAPTVVGEAISLAANQLVLRDQGRTAAMEVPGKPIGSVHGDSIGVHACDSANAWRNLSRAGTSRNTFACLILGAYQVALDRTNRGGDFLNWQPLPLASHLAGIKETEADKLLALAEEAIRGNLQARAAACVAKYGEAGHEPRRVFDLMLKYATSEDGSLHAEKFYRTTSEEFAVLRPAFRWRQLIALARVTASEYGRPAPGYAQARELLKV